MTRKIFYDMTGRVDGQPPQEVVIFGAGPKNIHRGGGSNKQRRFTGVVEQLKSRPGEWGQVPVAEEERAGRRLWQMADNIRRGQYAAFTPSHEFEATAEDGILWARWTGGSSLTCRDCGTEMWISTEGTAHHWGETPDSIDHDLDADHVPVPGE